MVVIILLPYLFFEIFLSLDMLERIGALGATLWTISTILIGTILLRQAPFTLLGNLHAVSRGKLDLQKFQDATTAYLLGAILLILPGVLSDFLGVFALLYTVYLQFVAKIDPHHPKENDTYTHKGEHDVIDVEIIEDDTTSNRHTHRR